MGNRWGTLAAATLALTTVVGWNASTNSDTSRGQQRLGQTRFGSHVTLCQESAVNAEPSPQRHSTGSATFVPPPAPKKKHQPDIWDISGSEGSYYEHIQHPNRAETHVILGHLLGPDLIEKYNVYRNNIVSKNRRSPDTDIVLAKVDFGTRVDGHPGVVHGGILSLLLDDMCGYAFEEIGVRHAVTAYLNVNFVTPVLAGTSVVIRIRLSKESGRKLYFDAQMTNPEGTVLYVDAKSLFIVPREYFREEEDQQVA